MFSVNSIWAALLKKKILLFLAVLCLLLGLTACSLAGADPSTCEHVYDDECDNTCNKCGAVREAPHAYENACATKCPKCGAERVTEHKYDNACDPECNVCGAKREVPGHVYDNACDAVCNVCGETREVSEHVYETK